MNSKHTENTSAAVPQGAKQAEDIHGRWPWVERSVWSECMLQALEHGVKGGKWFSLIDKVSLMDNLSASWMKQSSNGGSAGADGQSIRQFTWHLSRELDRLQGELKSGTYRALPVKRSWIPKPGSSEKRPLGIPAVRDRIVQGAIRNVLEPIFERTFAEHSYGFRPGRGCKDALRRVDRLLNSGKTWVVDVDFRKYFDTIPHGRLMERVKELISDGKLLGLLEGYLHAGVLDGMKGWEPTTQGTPQGAVISPLLANLYLNSLDHMMAQAGFEMTRYADDFVVQCASQAEAEQALGMVEAWARENELVVHPEKTRIVDATQRGGFDFLGYHFERGMKWPREKSLGKLKEVIRTKTRRTQGDNIRKVIETLNPSLKGWFEYFKHSHRWVFGEVDGMVRRRLRSILCKQNKRPSLGTGKAHFQWPNAYFDRLGLYSLASAHQLVLQSQRQ